LLNYSEDVDSSFATKQGVVVASGDNTAPNGTQTADRIEQDASTGFHRLAKTGFSANYANTFSAWLKADEVTTVALAIYAGAGFTARVSFDLSNGTIASTQDGAGQITDAGNGWYLCKVFSSSGSASSTLYVYSELTSTFTGTSGDGFFIWGAHLYRSDLGGMVDNPDRGDSYVPTTSSAVYLPRRGHHVYNGSTWVNEGLLVESESRQNIYLYSENSGAWLPQNATITANVTTAPDGNTTADNFANNDAGLIAFHYAKNSIILTTSTQYTLSVFAKYNTGSGIIWLLGETSADKFCYFDIQNGLVTLSTNFDNATITDYGNGWYRCAATFTKTSATSSEEIGVGVCLTSGTPNFDSTGIANQEQVYLWGAQLEEGSTPSSYIPTAGSAITRAAETLTIPSANLPWPTPNVIGPELQGNALGDRSALSGSYSGALTSYVFANNGSVFQISVTISNYTAGLLDIGDNADRNTIVNNLSSNGTYIYYFVPDDGTIYFTSDASADYTLDVSVKEIDPLSVSIQMDGRVTYADEGTTEIEFLNWEADSNNLIDLYLSAASTATGRLVYRQKNAGTSDVVETNGLIYSPGILVPYNIASRHGYTFVNGAVDGTALTADTTPVALPDLSSTDLDLAYDYMGTIRTFRIWDADLTDEGIAYVSERSEEPTISLSFNSSESSFTVSDWLP
jgi:hypothetical protein